MNSTITKVYEELKECYNFLDYRCAYFKENDDWISIVSTFRFTNKEYEEIKEYHDKLRRLSHNTDWFKIEFEILKSKEWKSKWEEIKKDADFLKESFDLDSLELYRNLENNYHSPITQIDREYNTIQFNVSSFDYKDHHKRLEYLKEKKELRSIGITSIYPIIRKTLQIQFDINSQLFSLFLFPIYFKIKNLSYIDNNLSGDIEYHKIFHESNLIIKHFLRGNEQGIIENYLIEDEIDLNKNNYKSRFEIYIDEDLHQVEENYSQFVLNLYFSPLNLELTDFKHYASKLELDHEDIIPKKEEILNEDNFISKLRETLDERFYTLLEKMEIGGDWATFFLIFSQRDRVLRLIKINTEPINEINKDLYLNEAKKLIKYENRKIVKAFDNGKVEFQGEEYFFTILEHIKGKSFDKIPEHVFKENNSLEQRLKLFSEILETIEVFREDYAFHNDLHLGNIMLTNGSIKIIDFLPSKDAYTQGKPDPDLYMIQNELIDYFLTNDEKNSLFSMPVRSLNFKQIKERVNEELNKTQTPIDQESSIKIKCFEAFEHIIKFYFENIDETTHRPKEFIEKERRTEIISDIVFLNNYNEIASSIGIFISGTWDPTTHSRGINHEIFIIVNNNLILKIIQHEYGEAMRINLTLNGKLIIKLEEVKSAFTTIKNDLKKPSIIEPEQVSKKELIEIAQEIENDFQKMLEKNSIEGDLEFHFVIFPIKPPTETFFEKKNYENIRKTIRTHRYGPYFISSSFDYLFNELTSLRSGIYAIRNVDYPSGNIFISKEGVIIFHYCYRKIWDRPENYKRFNSYYISGVLLGFFDFIDKIFQIFSFSGKISFSLNIEKIEDWKFSPISMDFPVDDEAYYYFQPKRFKPYVNKFDLNELKIKENRIEGVQDIMSEILLDFGYDREFKIDSRILEEY